jgi:hypothetical protein
MGGESLSLRSWHIPCFVSVRFLLSQEKGFGQWGILGHVYTLTLQ